MSAATTATYAVGGMTCEHCVRAVTEELTALPGVQHVTVELVPGGPTPVTVTSSAPLAPGDVRAAVDEAGYDLLGDGAA
ncbi:heavy-metal-associated domain-containing protein [Kineococcus rubinsiae]|uniref:heavy-metal-associated domain-containing protein n=1 Tax=Kineococcus rubinsiae TaxID=2609562 RepID=UPI0027E47767|nr:heavy metal-associated domain-containing protein [Kineococcus rubinsiae]